MSAARPPSAVRYTARAPNGRPTYPSADARPTPPGASPAGWTARWPAAPSSESPSRRAGRKTRAPRRTFAPPRPLTRHRAAPASPGRVPRRRGGARRAGRGRAAPLVAVGDQHAAMFSDPALAGAAPQDTRYIAPWDVLQSPRSLAALDDYLAAARAANVRVLLSLGHAQPAAVAQGAAERRAVRERVPRPARPLPVDHRLRGVERGEPLQPADLPPPGAGRSLLQRRAADLLGLPHRRRRSPRHGDGRGLGAPLPAGGARAAHLGPAQLHRREPPERACHLEVPAAHPGPGVVHRDRRPREAQEPLAHPLPAGDRARRQGHGLGVQAGGAVAAREARVLLRVVARTPAGARPGTPRSWTGAGVRGRRLPS